MTAHADETPAGPRGDFADWPRGSVRIFAVHYRDGRDGGLKADTVHAVSADDAARAVRARRPGCAVERVEAVRPGEAPLPAARFIRGRFLAVPLADEALLAALDDCPAGD